MEHDYNFLVSESCNRCGRPFGEEAQHATSCAGRALGPNVLDFNARRGEILLRRALTRKETASG